MDTLYIKQDLDKADDEVINIMEEVRSRLMTPEVVMAMLAGCQFDVTVERKNNTTTISLKSREKISILKSSDGTPLSVVVQKK